MKRDDLIRAAQRFGAPASLIALLIAAAILSPNFMTPGNIRLQLQQFALSTALIAVGQTLVILTGGIDLSVGALLALGSCITGRLILGGAATPLVVLLPIAATTLFGAFSGTIVARARIQPIVVTLAVMIAARGLALLVSGDSVLNLTDEALSGLATRQLGPFPLVGSIPVSVVIALAVYALVAFALRTTVAGRYVFAVGGNERAARLAGVESSRVKIVVYALSGLLAGLAGVLYAGDNSTADPLNDGSFFELSTIAAVVVGGTSLLGGVGGVWRTLVGGLILSVLYALFIQVGLPTPTQLIAQGLIIAGAVVLQGGGEA